MIQRVAVLLLLSAALFPALAECQTLDEVERPLLRKGQTVVSTDYGLFASEFFVTSVGSGSYSLFQPTQHVLLPTLSFGASKSVQFNLSGTYLLPRSVTFDLFGDGDSPFVSHSLVKSFSPEVIVRRGNRLELHVGGTTARARSDSYSPIGNATAVNTTFDTNALQVRGIWLTRPDDESRSRRADLDGLLGPLLGKHRAAIRWDGLWRRYRSVDSEAGPVALTNGHVVDTVHSTDVRLRVGVAYGTDDHTQVSGDAYWQPSFNVSESNVSSDFLPGVVRVEDNSRRLSGLFGLRAGQRWRAADRLELRTEGIFEHQSVTESPAPTNSYRLLRINTGATWLSHPKASGAPLTADASGLYGPLLEQFQFRVDGLLRSFRSFGSDAGSFRYWRADAAMGLLSFLEASVYVGGLGGSQSVEGHSLGGSLRFRASRWVDAYATVNYHPGAWMTEYPVFVLPQGSLYRAYEDLLNKNYDDDASLHVGVRFFLK